MNILDKMRACERNYSNKIIIRKNGQRSVRISYSNITGEFQLELWNDDDKEYLDSFSLRGSSISQSKWLTGTIRYHGLKTHGHLYGKTIYKNDKVIREMSP